MSAIQGPQPTAAPLPPPSAPSKPPEKDERKEGGVVLFRTLDLQSMVFYNNSKGEQAVFIGIQQVDSRINRVVVKALKKMECLPQPIHEKRVIEQLHSVGVRHVVPLLDTIENVDHPFFAGQSDQKGKNMALVFPFRGEAAYNLSKREIPFSIKYWRQVARQALETLSDLAAVKVVHNDFSAANLVVEGESPPLVTVIDWEVAMKAPNTIHEPRAAYYCRAPEYYVGAKEYTTAVDMWAMGCLLYQMAVGKRLFINEQEVLATMVSVLGPPSRSFAEGTTKGCFAIGADGTVSLKAGAVKPHITLDVEVISHLVALHEAKLPEAQAFANLMTRMLRWDPLTRITAADALKHPFFTEASQWQ